VTSTGATAKPPLLEVRGLSLAYGKSRGGSPAVDDVSLALSRGEVLGLAGESGSGKSSLARGMVRLLEPLAGQVLLDGKDLGGLRGAALLEARRRLQVIFQDPATALSPRRTIGQSLLEPLRHFALGGSEEHPGMVHEALAAVGMDDSCQGRYPHEFSSGQRQRIAIARALIARPDLLIADEPVSALDVSVQAQVLTLLLRLREERGIAVLLISHDLAVIRQLADSVAVMYRGRLVEHAPADALFANPMHPYTRQLLAAVPGIEPGRPRSLPVPGAALTTGSRPGLGCAFRRRCPVSMEACAGTAPVLAGLANDPAHRVECLRYEEHALPIAD